MEKQQPFDGILLVSDIDGTLTDLTQVSRRNIEAIERFIVWADILPCVPDDPDVRWEKFCGRCRSMRRSSPSTEATSIQSGAKKFCLPPACRIRFSRLSTTCSSALNRLALCWWSRTTTGSSAGEMSRSKGWHSAGICICARAAQALYPADRSAQLAQGGADCTTAADSRGARLHRAGKPTRVLPGAE